MGRKTFISYKYSEAQTLRDDILTALGKDATFYQGETSDSPDMTDLKTDTIKKNLTDMMFHTSVTIVIISPAIKQSKWIDWEIEYCLKKISREERTSMTNGILAVIQKVNGSYDWYKSLNLNSDGCSSTSYLEHLVYDIIKNNRYNQNPKKYVCNTCQSINSLTGSYISYVQEETFLKDPQKYIENAFEKSENVDGYDLTKQK
jgi:hypothetical protein